MTTKTGVKRVKTPEELISGLRRQVKAAEKQAVNEDPWMLADMLTVADELKQAAVAVVASWDAPSGRLLPAAGREAFEERIQRVLLERERVLRGRHRRD